ncbi:GH25 family lysozyme [Specibacter sp. NPDC057265]|uniref:GH25 family lysozyme n=1 Tax=Specibacter sp. NPDC057265 TaxID=3346075 RepID=UPI00363A3384
MSGWQQNVNWTAVKNNGAKFAYVKTSEGPWTLNDYFSQQYNGAANAGLLRGGYHFARPNVSSGSSQARVMLASGGGWTADGKTLPPALDIEDNPYVASDGTNKCYGMTPSALVAWAKDFTSTIKSSTGKDAVIYSSYYFWQECLGGSNAFANSNPLWIAAYYASSPWMPGKWPAYTFWQYANNFADAGQSIPATFPGDQNVFNGTMDQLRTLAGVKTVAPKPPASPQAVVGLIPGAKVLSGKWAGDGKSYVGWYKDSQWCLEIPGNKRTCFFFGSPGDKPVVGDWNGDGIDSIGIVRNGSWQLSNSVTKRTVDIVQSYGVGSDTPITGDWNGDGKTTIGIFRNGSWQVTNSQGPGPRVDVAANFGVASDIPVVGDWNADGWDTFGVWRRGSYWLTDSQLFPPVHYAFGFGVATDSPAIGDWNGDNRTTVGIVRGNTWQLTNSLSLRKVDSVRF